VEVVRMMMLSNTHFKCINQTLEPCALKANERTFVMYDFLYLLHNLGIQV